MRLLAILILGLVTSLPAVAQSAASHVAPQKLKTSSNKRLEREILNAENLLGKAIARRDVTSLEKLLTDYYADAFEGSEQAASKKTTLARCKSGSLRFYRISEERSITTSVDIVTVEGNALSGQQESEAGKNEAVHVKRLWTKRDGRWQLLGQTVGPAEED
jgi:hypothetical protein